MLVSSLKTKETMFTNPIEWLPRVWNWQNYPNAINYPNFPFLRFLWNSTYYAVAVTVGTVISCAMVGYAFARLRFPLRKPLFVRHDCHADDPVDGDIYPDVYSVQGAGHASPAALSASRCWAPIGRWSSRPLAAMRFISL